MSSLSRQIRLPGMEAEDSDPRPGSQHGQTPAPPAGDAEVPPPSSAVPAAATSSAGDTTPSSVPASAPGASPSSPSGSSPPEVSPGEGAPAAGTSPEPPPSASEPPREGTIYAIDAHSLIFQVFHAMADSELSNPQGEPVGAVYGFTRDLLQLVERQRPVALICAFDLPGPTFRNELYAEYKADRTEMPGDLQSQLPKIRDVLDALAIPVVAVPGYEADDVLAALAAQCDAAGAQLRVVTGDKDCRQLISDRVSIFNIRKNEIYDAKALARDWGIRPNQVVDFQALVGDKIDNVPGVPLIGPKVARELLETYGDLTGVLAHADEVAGAKRRQNLIDYREQALLSRRLVELDRQTPIDVDWQAARWGGGSGARLAELFRDYGFRTLADRAAAIAGLGVPVAEPAPRPEVAYRVVDTLEELQSLVAELQSQTLLCVDVETTSIVPREAEIVGYALSWAPQTGCYIPVRGPAEARVIDPIVAADLLRPILEDPQIAKVGQNLKYDWVALRSAGIRLAGIAFDTMVASYLLDAGERSHNLDQLALRYLDHETIKIESLIGTGKHQKRMDEVPTELVGPYAAEDADLPLRLKPLLERRLTAEGLNALHNDVETPLVELLAELEYLGVAVDVHRLGELHEQYQARLDQLATEIEQLAGRPLNIASPKQLAELLFGELGLPVLKKTKTGPSTDASVLEELAPLHALPAKIVEHRQYAKLLGTYIDALPQLVHPETGRVHASLNQVVAATGRLSSSHPNLQNIPVRTREGREIRSAFRAGPPGWQLLAADYSQIELRVLAHFCGDAALTAAFAANQDIHRLVASEVEGVPLDQVSAGMRRRAKAVNFGVIYGQSPFGLAKSLGIDQTEAAAFIEQYFARYRGVLEFFVETLNRCRETGFVTTLLGRRRAIQGVRPVPPDLRDPKTGAVRQFTLPERTAVNTVIQGSAADLIKLAMLRVRRRLATEQRASKMLLQIHDELLFESPPDELDDLAVLAREEMAAAYPLSVPLQVDVKSGPNWAECEPWA